MSFSRKNKTQNIIENLLLGLPAEAIWTKQDPFGKTILLSGFNIINSIVNFKTNKFPLKNLRILKHLEGRFYSELNFTDQRNLMRTTLVISTINYDADPLLMCLFVESINKDKYKTDAAQLARNITFKNASNIINNIIRNIPQQRNTHIQNKRKFHLRFQTEILLCILMLYIKDNNLHTQRQTPKYERYRIPLNDHIEDALNKLMLIINTHPTLIEQEIIEFKHFLLLSQSNNLS